VFGERDETPPIPFALLARQDSHVVEKEALRLLDQDHDADDSRRDLESIHS
jgi:hypothetical protein